MIVRFYNSTSVLQRRVVFRADKDEITAIATHAAHKCLERAGQSARTHWRYEYSPVHTGTELTTPSTSATRSADHRADADAGPADHQPARDRRDASPNVYADSIEWMHRNLARRDSILLSLHPHNDRGEAVAAAELGYLASGADRIEGCLFRQRQADRERLPGDPGHEPLLPRHRPANLLLRHRRIRRTVEVLQPAERPRTPPPTAATWSTAFSGSHQDAPTRPGPDEDRRRCGRRRCRGHRVAGALPIDPKDVGRNYEAVIRVNSQSGKGGVAYIMKADHGMNMPRRLQIEFSRGSRS